MNIQTWLKILPGPNSLTGGKKAYHEEHENCNGNCHHFICSTFKRNYHDIFSFILIRQILAQTNYRPQRSCGKVIFLHMSVIQFTGEGVCGRPPKQTSLADTPPPLGRHCPRQRPPCADIPLVVTPGQTPSGQTPPWADTPPTAEPLWVDTIPGQTPTLGRPPLPPVQCMLGYGQQAGGTHPTGMHTCFMIFLDIFWIYFPWY